MPKVICVVGELGSGKGTVADYFESKGYEKYALRDRVREEMESKGIELTRKNMQDFADNFRKTLGLDIFAKKTEELFLKTGAENVVIESIRNPAELEYLRNKYQAKIISVVADVHKRFEMIKARKRFGDPQTFEEFKKVDDRDKGIGQDISGQQVAACLKMADVVVENNGTIEDLYEKLNEI